ncbi:hypothetical protein AWM68_09045 [Fictibacillus phosphorivorans]|uniref:SGNH/GDSL hydrolase family protein n=1 Tax=Fictibacillus phosphorivorans TaxID=1221500 RepID=A0A165N7W6_9BACL|nr:hypothetical protein [Fictibacillus phosphorivorans]KZE64957.1 hypothetical protein AWM68_09045 [Fictibacillus phosphorivorans]
MGRLFIKLTIIIGVVILLFMPVNKFVKDSYDYNIDHEILAFKKHPYPVDIINLGASHSMYGYYFKPTGLSHLDLALPSQTIQYDYKLLKEYGEHLKPGGVVLVSISQMTFANSEAKNIGNYYKVLDRSDIEPFHLIDYYSYLYLPGTNTGSLTSAVAGKLKNLRWDSHQPWANNGKNYSGRKYMKIEDQYREAEENNSIEPNVKQLREIVDLCSEKGYKVVLTIEPVHQSYLDYFDENVMNRLVFQHIEALNLDVPLLNYMSDQRFVDKKEYFIDPDHLNSEGRKKFSWIVYEELKRMGYL